MACLPQNSLCHVVACLPRPNAYSQARSVCACIKCDKSFHVEAQITERVCVNYFHVRQR